MIQPLAARRIDSLLALPRSAKKALAILADSALCVLTVWLAICFRFESWISLSGYQWLAVILSIVLAIPLLTAFGFYHTVIRYVGRQTITAALRAIGIYAIIYSAIFTAYSFPLVPRTIGIMQPLLLLISIALIRLLANELLSEQLNSNAPSTQQFTVLIYGAGNSGQQLASSLKTSSQTQIVGFLDDNKSLQNALISGIPVFSPTSLDSIVNKYGVRDVLLAMPSISRSQRNSIIQKLSSSEVAIRTLPRLSDLAQGHINESDLRKLDIEDLLGRDPVPPDSSLLSKNIAGKVVLITGAGGSIGSEITRQVHLLNPKQLVLFDVSEYSLYSLQEELTTCQHNLQITGVGIRTVLGSVLDKQLVNEVFQKYRPDTVFHAAAYKHVPLVESNIRAAIINNIAGTMNVASAALAHGCSKFTLISTDKAVRPTNVMGATKRIAELCIHHIQTNAYIDEATTQFSIVRFGNVLASSGSVVPKFREQIAKGGPVTITHPDITRYFMTIPEAAQLVIQAGAIPRAAGVCTYLLDMGEPVKIYDLARTMIQLAGLPVADESSKNGIPIVFTGLRTGEKLYEELLVDGKSLKTTHPKIMLDTARVLNNTAFSATLSLLLSRNTNSSEEELIALLTQLLPEFHHKRDN